MNQDQWTKRQQALAFGLGVGHHAVWDQIIKSYHRAPVAHGPWRPTSYRIPPPKLCAVEWAKGKVTTHNDNEDHYLDLDGTTPDIDRFCNIFLSISAKGTRYVFRNGRKDFLVFWKILGKALVERGYKIKPWVQGKRGAILALQISKDKRSWYFIDLEMMTGLSGDLVEPGVMVLWDLLQRYVKAIEQNVGESPRLTIGSTTIHAAAKTLPAPVWSPASPVVTMCREGGGYRGGILQATEYDGPAYAYDINGAYLSVLDTPMPTRRVMGPCVREDGTERDGIFLCTIYGPGNHPIYISTWNGKAFEPMQWNGNQVVCVLPSSEFAGIRALGYEIDPKEGIIFANQFTFKNYQEKLIRMMNRYKRGSFERSISKLLAVSLYGKLGQRESRIEYMHSTERPGEDWSPMLSEDAESDTELWQRTHVQINAHGHVDMAAAITGAARGKVYAMIARARDAGCRVLLVNTDTIVTNKPIPDLDDSTAVGGWRLEASDQAAVIKDIRHYQIGDKRVWVESRPGETWGSAAGEDAIQRRQLDATMERMRDAHSGTI